MYIFFILTFRFWIKLVVAYFHTAISLGKGQKHKSNQKILFHAMPISQGFYSLYTKNDLGVFNVLVINTSVCLRAGAYDRKGTCNTAAGKVIHKSCVSLKSESTRKPQFLVLSPMSEPVAQGHSTWVGLQDHRKVFPEINGTAEPKMTEGAPSGMLIYQGFTCWLMIAITVCIWQTQLDMCSEKFCIWSWIILDLYNFLFYFSGCHSVCQ